MRRELLRVPGALHVARLTVETIRVCLRYRVTGLASEAGFFMLLSLPPLVLGLFGGVGYIGQWLGQDIVNQLLEGIQQFSQKYLVEGVVNSTIVPTANSVLQNGRFDLISIGFLLSIWSGSRALNVFVDTISIMYGQSGVRGIVRTRALSLSLYFLSLLVGIVVVPLVVIGPTWLKDLLPRELEVLALLYWPVVTVVAVASIATLFHISTPRRSPWLRDVPGALLTLLIWVLASFVLRGTLTASVGERSTSIYGPLSTPIVLLIWLYTLAIAVLIGAALNAAVRHLWPVEERPSLRAKAVDWVRNHVVRRRGPAVAAEPAGAAREGDEVLTAAMDGARREAAKPLTPMPPSAPEGPREGPDEGTDEGTDEGMPRGPRRAARGVDRPIWSAPARSDNVLSARAAGETPVRHQ